MPVFQTSGQLCSFISGKDLISQGTVLHHYCLKHCEILSCKIFNNLSNKLFQIADKHKGIEPFSSVKRKKMMGYFDQGQAFLCP